jgi:hypothetical protein
MANDVKALPVVAYLVRWRATKNEPIDINPWNAIELALYLPNPGKEERALVLQSDAESAIAELRAEVERWEQSAREGWRYAKECDDGRVEEKQRTVTYVCPVCAASLERQE